MGTLATFAGGYQKQDVGFNVRNSTQPTLPTIYFDRVDPKENTKMSQKTRKNEPRIAKEIKIINARASNRRMNPL